MPTSGVLVGGVLLSVLSSCCADVPTKVRVSMIALGAIVIGMIDLAARGQLGSSPLDLPIAALAYVVILCARDSKFPLQCVLPGPMRGDGTLTTLVYLATVWAATRIPVFSHQWVIVASVVAACFISVIAIGQTALSQWCISAGKMGPVWFNGRGWGTLNNPVFLAGYLVLIIPFVAVRVLTDPLWWWWAEAVVVMGTAFVLTGCRAAYLGMLVTVPAYLWIGWTHGTLWHLLPVVALVAGAVKGAIYVQPKGHGLTIDLTYHPGSMGGRVYVWAWALKIWKMRPLLGWGYNLVTVQTREKRDVYDTMHNEPLQILVTVGAFGLIATAWIWGTVALSLPPLGIACGLIAYFVWLQGSWNHVGSANLWWALLGMAVVK